MYSTAYGIQWPTFSRGLGILLWGKNKPLTDSAKKLADKNTPKQERYHVRRPARHAINKHTKDGGKKFYGGLKEPME